MDKSTLSQYGLILIATILVSIILVCISPISPLGKGIQNAINKTVDKFMQNTSIEKVESEEGDGNEKPNSVLSTKRVTVHLTYENGDKIQNRGQENPIVLDVKFGDVIKFSELENQPGTIHLPVIDGYAPYSLPTEQVVLKDLDIKVVYKEISAYINYDTAGGNIVSYTPRTHKKGMETKLPEDVVKEGYTFVGWEIKSEDGTYHQLNNNTISADWTVTAGSTIEVRAIWEVAAFNVKFYADVPNDDVAGNVLVYTYRGKSTESQINLKNIFKYQISGYTATSCKINNIETEIVNIQDDQPDINVIVTFTRIHKLVFDMSESGTFTWITQPSTTEFLDKATVTLPSNANISREGYRLTGWVDENGNSVNNTFQITKDTTLKPVWTADGYMLVVYNTISETMFYVTEDSTISGLPTNVTPNATIKLPTISEINARLNKSQQRPEWFYNINGVTIRAAQDESESHTVTMSENQYIELYANTSTISVTLVASSAGSYGPGINSSDYTQTMEVPIGTSLSAFIESVEPPIIPRWSFTKAADNFWVVENGIRKKATEDIFYDTSKKEIEIHMLYSLIMHHASIIYEDTYFTLTHQYVGGGVSEVKFVESYPLEFSLTWKNDHQYIKHIVIEATYDGETTKFTGDAAISQLNNWLQENYNKDITINAYTTPKAYTAIFELGYDTNEYADSIFTTITRNMGEGININEVLTPERDGYIFAGWYFKADSYQTTITEITDDAISYYADKASLTITCIAKWEKIKEVKVQCVDESGSEIMYNGETLSYVINAETLQDNKIKIYANDLIEGKLTTISSNSMNASTPVYYHLGYYGEYVEQEAITITVKRSVAVSITLAFEAEVHSNPNIPQYDPKVLSELKRLPQMVDMPIVDPEVPSNYDDMSAEEKEEWETQKSINSVLRTFSIVNRRPENYGGGFIAKIHNVPYTHMSYVKGKWYDIDEDTKQSVYTKNVFSPLYDALTSSDKGCLIKMAKWDSINNNFCSIGEHESYTLEEYPAFFMVCFENCKDTQAECHVSFVR